MMIAESQKRTLEGGVNCRRLSVVTCLIRGVADGIPYGSHAWKQRGKTVKKTERQKTEQRNVRNSHDIKSKQAKGKESVKEVQSKMGVKVQKD